MAQLIKKDDRLVVRVKDGYRLGTVRQVRVSKGTFDITYDNSSTDTRSIPKRFTKRGVAGYGKGVDVDAFPEHMLNDYLAVVIKKGRTVQQCYNALVTAIKTANKREYVGQTRNRTVYPYLLDFANSLANVFQTTNTDLQGNSALLQTKAEIDIRITAELPVEVYVGTVRVPCRTLVSNTYAENKRLVFNKMAQHLKTMPAPEPETMPAPPINAVPSNTHIVIEKHIRGSFAFFTDSVTSAYKAVTLQKEFSPSAIQLDDKLLSQLHSNKRGSGELPKILVDHIQHAEKRMLDIATSTFNLFGKEALRNSIYPRIANVEKHGQIISEFFNNNVIVARNGSVTRVKQLHDVVLTLDLITDTYKELLLNTTGQLSRTEEPTNTTAIGELRTSLPVGKYGQGLVIEVRDVLAVIVDGRQCTTGENRGMFELDTVEYVGPVPNKTLRKFTVYRYPADLDQIGQDITSFLVLRKYQDIEQQLPDKVVNKARTTSKGDVVEYKTDGHIVKGIVYRVDKSNNTMVLLDTRMPGQSLDWIDMDVITKTLMLGDGTINLNNPDYMSHGYTMETIGKWLAY